MKTLIASLALCLAFSHSISAQDILGTFNQTALIAPDAYRNSAADVNITKDANSPSKKIWVTGLIPNGKLYAILYLNDDGNLIYSVPKQKAGNYQVNIGCITYNDGELTISLNNAQTCAGMSPKDYDKPIAVNGSGVSAGKTKVGTNGKIKTDGVNIGDDGITVDPKVVMAGIQYVGVKK